MEKKKSYQSWTISDEFWEAIKDEIPKKERDPNKKYVHAPGQGRKPMPARKALESSSRLLPILNVRFLGLCLSASWIRLLFPLFLKIDFRRAKQEVVEKFAEGRYD